LKIGYCPLAEKIFFQGFFLAKNAQAIRMCGHKSPFLLAILAKKKSQGIKATDKGTGRMNLAASLIQKNTASVFFCSQRRLLAGNQKFFY
jgi:hypothetical protein